MNTKLKIYARETKEGKEIHQTQIISISSPNLKTIDYHNQSSSLALYKARIKAAKPNSSLEHTIDEKYSYLKCKAKPKRKKELNKSLSHGIKGNANCKKDKSQPPLRHRTVSKEKVEASINVIITLKEKISQLNNQVDLFEEEHDSIVHLGQGVLKQLQKENEELKVLWDIQQAKVVALIAKEREKVQKKKEAILLLKQSIEERDNHNKALGYSYCLQRIQSENTYKNYICASKLSFQQALIDLDNRIYLISTQPNKQCPQAKDLEMINVNSLKNKEDHTIEKCSNQKPIETIEEGVMPQSEIKASLVELLSKEQVNEVSFLLRVLFSVYSLDIETIIANTIEEKDSEITIESVSDNLLSLIDSNNVYNKALILRFFTTLINDTSSLGDATTNSINVNMLKQHFSSLIGTIPIFASKKKIGKLEQLDRQKLLEAFKEKDLSHSGLIPFEEFLAAFSQANEVLGEDIEYIVYLMKQDTSSHWKLDEVNYMKLIDSIEKKSIKELNQDTVIDLLKTHLRGESGLTLEDFLSPFEYLMSRIDGMDYLDTKLFNSYLRDKKVIQAYEIIPPDKDNMHNITAIKRVLNK